MPVRAMARRWPSGGLELFGSAANPAIAALSFVQALNFFVGRENAMADLLRVLSPLTGAQMMLMLWAAGASWSAAVGCI